ncbi:uncharacterized protein LOC132718222 [Ruditapes philippinarum]|uniref:uncharacterized protein LOC132718222 n=1 Tax=Ruditapes philippinarum TaxID=129788 RepID=UPI00295A83F2|nr:uncharacterized protein LOC132718222 [Ruditapes philippinarum]
MKILRFSEKPSDSVKQNLAYLEPRECDTRADQIEILIDSHNGTAKGKEQVVDVTYEQIATQCNEIKVFRRLFCMVICINTVIFCVCIITVALQVSDFDGKFENFTSMTVTSNNRDVSDFQKSLISNESMKIVQEHIFCTTCKVFSGIQRLFVRTVDEDRCCVKDVLSLIQLIRSTGLKSLNEYSSEISILKTSIDDIREDTKALTDALFSSNKTNETDTNIGSTAKENIMWSMLMKNNRLFNLVLNRRRSVLYLIGIGIWLSMIIREKRLLYVSVCIVLVGTYVTR